MREIKFRAFVENNIIEGRPAEMYQVVRIDWDDNGIVCAELYSPKTQTFHILKVEWFKLVEYTGLKDKNGKEIYEGDIVYMVGEKDVVGWSYRHAGFILNRVRDNSPSSIPTPEEGLDVEVIGNIYENKELLT